MGYGIYLKAKVNKQGKAALFYKITSGRDKLFKKNIGVLIQPKDWSKRTYQIHSKAENAVIYNEKINEAHTLLKKAWSLYESETYDWDEMVSFLGGSKPDMDVKTFCDTIIKPVETDSLYKGVIEAYGAVRKVLGRELSFNDLSEKTVDLCVKDWKERLRSASLKTYKYHFGVIINAAYEKKLTPYKYEPKKKWRKSRDKTNKKTGRAFISTSTPEQFLKAIDESKTLLDIEALGFWLLMFGMRGLYPTDLCNIHKYEWEIQIDPPQSKLFHQRNKTNEPMDIVFSYPFDDLAHKLRGYLEVTHGYKSNVKTGKRFLRTKEYILSKNETLEGWFFNGYNKDTWGLFTKKLRELNFSQMKDARKTFDTIATTLPISQAVWYHLTGHELEGVKKAYSSKDWEEISEQIDEAHEQVLAKFNIDIIYPKLIDKANKMLEEQGLDSKQFNENWDCWSSKEFEALNTEY